MLRDRDVVKIVDICSGTGIGGYLFAKVIMERGYRVTLALVDMRSNALVKSREWISRELGVYPDVFAIDATSLHTLRRRYDLVIMWGSSTPHFSPWYMNRDFLYL